jgi:hypothetical protein
MNYGKTLVRSIALLGALIAAIAAPAAAWPSPKQARAAGPVACVVGYVCIQHLVGGVTYVPEGERRQFTGGLWIAGITNGTQVTYCVMANPSFRVNPWQTVTRTQVITGVVPSPPGTVCATV